MTQTAGELGLPDEARPLSLLIPQLGAHDLDGDEAPEEQIIGPVDDPDRAAPDLFLQGVALAQISQPHRHVR